MLIEVEKMSPVHGAISVTPFRVSSPSIRSFTKRISCSACARIFIKEMSSSIGICPEKPGDRRALPPAARGAINVYSYGTAGRRFLRGFWSLSAYPLLYLGDYARRSGVFRVLLLITRMQIALDPDFSLEPGGYPPSVSSSIK